MKHHRGWWMALVLAPVAVVGDASIASAEPLDLASRDTPTVLPHGVRFFGGRYSIDVCDHDDRGYCLSHRLLPESYRPDVNGPLDGPDTSGPASTWMSPTDVLKAYNIPSSSSAKGRIVALVDEPDADAFSDVTMYRAGYKLPALPKCAGGLPDGKTPCFAQVDETGTPNYTSEDCKGGDGETGLDMAMVSAACPDCAILLVQMTSLYTGGTCKITDANFGPAMINSTATAKKLGASATSISYGGPEGTKDPTGYTTAGNLVLIASGDDGYDFGKASGGPSYPASAPDVLAVGGTNLAPSGTGYTETVWNNDVGVTTSGCSGEFAMPAFQTDYLKTHSGAFAGCSKRANADLSAAASFGSGDGGGRTDGIALVTGGKWINYWGTSAAAPMVAAILTRLDLTEKISADLGFVYTNESAFNDITSGNDETKQASCKTNMCVAGAGWDGPSGLGTPDGEKLMALAGSSSSGSSSGGGSGGSSSGGKDAGSDSSSGGKKGSGSGGSGSGGSGGSGSSGSSSGSGVDAGLALGSDGGGGSDTSLDGDSGSGGGMSCTVSRERGGSQLPMMLSLGGLALAGLVRRRRTGR